MSLSLNMALGTVVKRLRKHQGMTQGNLALKSEVHINTISLLERGKIEVKLSTLFFLAKSLRISLDTLMDLLLQELGGRPLDDFGRC